MQTDYSSPMPIIDPYKPMWQFERSSGFPGYRCNYCKKWVKWVHEYQTLSCPCTSKIKKQTANTMPNPNKIFVQINEFFYSSEESAPNEFKLNNSKKPQVCLEHQSFNSIADILVFLQKNYPLTSSCPAIFLTEDEYNTKTRIPEKPNALYLKSSMEFKYWIAHKINENCFTFRKLQSNGSINPYINHSGEHKTFNDAFHKAFITGALPILFSEIQFNKIID